MKKSNKKRNPSLEKQKKTASSSAQKKAGAIYTVKPHLGKAFVAILCREAIAPLIFIMLIWAFQYFDYYFIIQDIGSSIDIAITKQAIDTVIFYLYFVIVAIGVMIMIGHYMPFTRLKMEYDKHEVRVRDEIIPYKQVLRVNFKNDLFHHKILQTQGLYLLFTGREYLPLFIDFVDDAKDHAQRLVDFAEQDKGKRYKK